MSIMITFILGELAGIFILAFGFGFMKSKKKRTLLVDPYWLESEDRWLSFRRILLTERGIEDVDGRSV